MLSENSRDDSHWPPELILLREKLTAKSQLEIAQLKIKHEEEVSSCSIYQINVDSSSSSSLFGFSFWVASLIAKVTMSHYCPLKAKLCCHRVNNIFPANYVIHQALWESSNFILCVN